MKLSRRELKLVYGLAAGLWAHSPQKSDICEKYLGKLYWLI